MLKHKNLLLLGTLLFILLAVALVSILNRTSSSPSQGDVRARAAMTNSLELIGTVNSVDDLKGIIVLDTVYLSDNNRAGEAQSMGTWTVVAPVGFNFASVVEGQTVKVGIEAISFSVENHTVSALSIVPIPR